MCKNVSFHQLFCAKAKQNSTVLLWLLNSIWVQSSTWLPRCLNKLLCSRVIWVVYNSFERLFPIRNTDWIWFNIHHVFSSSFCSQSSGVSKAWTRWTATPAAESEVYSSWCRENQQREEGTPADHLKSQQVSWRCWTAQVEWGDHSGQSKREGTICTFEFVCKGYLDKTMIFCVCFFASQL